MPSITGGWSADSSRLGSPRLQRGPITTALQLGPLASLVGSWSGPGFNAIWRPDNEQPPANSAIHRFLELNLTNDSFEFQVIPGAVPNRGFDTQADLELFGLHYLQRTKDADPPPFSTAGQALHIEPGLFMNVPGSEANNDQATIVRMGSIPHGTTVLMQGPNPGAEVQQGIPTIPVLQPFANFPGVQPFTTTAGVGIQPIGIAPSSPGPPAVTYGAEHVVPENQNTAADAAFPATQSNGPYPPEFQGFVNDPNSVLRDAIAGQDILGFIQIDLSAPGVGQGIENIPFLGIPNMDYSDHTAAVNPTNPVDTDPTLAGTTPNAFVYSAQATFWIEFVRIPFTVPAVRPADPDPAPTPSGVLQQVEPFFGQPTFLQLQYSQLVILVFNDILWPHVTVATMTLNNG
ncbi:MAG: heme-binding protein [Acidimicrobiales bacterium]|jgi:hypothetical protein